MGENEKVGNKIEIYKIHELLALENLQIPSYQRPYKWSTKNVAELLGDMDNAMQHTEPDYAYRLGTVIVHNNIPKKDETDVNKTEEDAANKKASTLDIVDGQQRIITLMLLGKVLGVDNVFKPQDESKITEKELLYKSVKNLAKIDLSHKETQNNLHNNYMFIKQWLNIHNDRRAAFENIFLPPASGEEQTDRLFNMFEVVYLSVDNLSEAFQLFDSQNTRGKALDPHDLLKAYHLRAMHDDMFGMNRAVKTWEAVKPEDIKTLFDGYMFPIMQWTDKTKTSSFTVRDIETYKGIDMEKGYGYAARASKAMPGYQLTEPFIAGSDFFAMVDYYLALKEFLVNAINTESKFHKLYNILEDKVDEDEKDKNGDPTVRKYNDSIGFRYAKVLFYCALMAYYDRFNNLDKAAVVNLFKWAMMLRVDMRSLGYSSINKYAVGEGDGKYSNAYDMFHLIKHARLHNEIGNLVINIKKKDVSGKWVKLLNDLEGVK